MSPLRIIFYHDIADSRDQVKAPKRYAPTVDEFREHITYIKSNYSVLSAEEVVECCDSGTFPRKPSIAVSFDDGLGGVLKGAEILHDMDVPAMVFLSTRFIESNELPWFIHLDDILDHGRDKGRVLMENGQEYRLADPKDYSRLRSRAKGTLLRQNYAGQIRILTRWASDVGFELGRGRDDEQTFLSWDDVAHLAANAFEVSSHTHSHVDLRVLDHGELEEEFTKPVELIRTNLENACGRFASYPDGRFDENVIDVARQHHQAAFATTSGAQWDCRYRIPRLGMFRGGVGVLQARLSWKYPLKSWVKRTVKKMIGTDSDGM